MGDLHAGSSAGDLSQPGAVPTAPLSVSPQLVDLGALGSGQTRAVTLEVTGGPGRAAAQCELIRVLPETFGAGGARLIVTVSPGPPGDEVDLVDSLVVLEAGGQRLEVPVRAWWEEPASGVVHAAVVATAAPAPVTASPAGPAPQQPQPDRRYVVRENPRSATPGRSWRGHACHWCGRSLYYDTATHEWLACPACRGPGVIPALCWRGLKEIGGGLKGIVETLSGR